MDFPVSISYTRDISPHITTHDIDEVMNIIEQESQSYGKIKCTRENNKLTITRRFFAWRPKGSNYLFDCIDYAVVEIDTDTHRLRYNFHIIITALFILGGFIAAVVLPYYYESIFEENPLIPIGVIIVGASITLFRLERYATKITDAINATFDKEEEVEVDLNGE